eukprot:SAG31_NODE_13491_length_865_cov_1.808094_1_plen_195_part_00
MAQTPQHGASSSGNIDSDQPPAAPPVEQDDDGEDLFDGNVIRDYVPDPVLDAYERGSDDDVDFEPVTAEQRRRAERNLRKRDKDEALAAGRIPRALESSSDEEEDRPRQRRRRAEVGDSAAETPDGEVYDDDDIDEMNVEGPPQQYFANENVARKIKNAFKRFLQNFCTPNGTALYAEKITEMCAANKQSLVVR